MAKHDDRRDRQIVLDDLKKRVIDLTQNNPTLPAVTWDATPVRYFKLNKEWCKILAGWLDHMESEAFWPDAEDQNYAGIQGFLAFEEGIELPVNPEIDCDLIEACIATSETINNLINLIENQQVIIDELEEQLNEQEENSPIDSVNLPPLPTNDTSGNAVCRSANFIASMLTAGLLEAWDKAKNLTLFEFVSAFLGVVWWDFTKAKEFWLYAQTIASPTLGEDAAVFEENIQQAFFCAELNLEIAIQYIQDDPAIPSLEKSLWIAIIDNYKQSQINEWAALGELQGTTPDCSDGCPWVVVWDFGGNYTPIGDEDEIYNGNNWEVSGGHYDDGNGYVADEEVMVITHDLPEQCSIHYYYMVNTKGPVCLAADYSVWWRGADGEQAEQYSPEGRQLSTSYAEQTYTILGNPVMSQLKVKGDGFFCGSSGQFGFSIGYVRIVGTGAKPSQ